ncbi:DUF7577 domain-containing protein [Haladaptatus cibarius]|uniref:DUF7577 domain-containing protein n=1 Tax=Haladaptatus cibarius TaxID=453847 RepID=UPI000679D74D|nr:zinc ribbon domain-containing protein [Haladaptatus cibarius]
MNVWGWIILYVVLFAGLQLLIYRFLRSDEDSPLLQSTPSGPDGRAPDDIRKESVLEEFNEPNTADPSTRLCPHCGTENGAEYTFCRECVEPLGVW